MADEGRGELQHHRDPGSRGAPRGAPASTVIVICVALSAARWDQLGEHRPVLSPAGPKTDYWQMRSAGLTRSMRVAPDAWTLVGLAAFLGLLFVALLGERIAPHEPIYFVVEHGRDPRPYDPGVVFPFGSDVLGRDIASLVLAGARATLMIAVLGGLARVVAGVLVAAVSSWWRPSRLATESLAELVAAVPATLVALVLVKVFVKGDTTAWVFIAALLVMGWAGPYRVIRAEVDRLAHAPFTQGAVVMGIGRSRLFLRHHLPHLVPVIALNLSQQIVASLVLVAELGVLSAFVGGTRLINVEESMAVLRTGIPTAALITDSSEWGGLLASARTVEALWTTRWLILVPGVAFAITAVAVAAIGFALARRYARRDVTDDLRGPGALVCASLVVALVLVSTLVPERFAAAREWSAAARAELRPAAETERSFADAGLRPLGSSFAVAHGGANITQTGPANVRIGAVSLTEAFPRNTSTAAFGGHVKAFVTAATGGGIVEAPLVYAARGITPAEHPIPTTFTRFGQQLPELGEFVRDYPDDYAGIDVRGKVVLLVRFVGIAAIRTYDAQGRLFRRADVQGIGVDTSIEKAISRGAAAVIFVDPSLPAYADVSTSFIGTGGMNPYLRLERLSPPQQASGVPVVILSGKAGTDLAATIGVDIPTAFMDYEPPNALAHTASLARDVGISARVEVPLARQANPVTSVMGEVPGVPGDIPRVLVWARRHTSTPHRPADVLAALARVVVPRGAPFIFVEFDPAAGTGAVARDLAPLLKERKIGLVIVLEQVDGTALNFVTPYGELIPAFDLYAARSGARHEVTRTTAPLSALSGLAPLADVPTVIVKGVGGFGDLRGDAVALLGYLAGRLALGAEELPR
jgi:peptide/nickel transport system permease protein